MTTETIGTLADSWNEPLVDPEFVLADLLIRNGSTVFYGDSGVGKSTTLRRFTLLAARGGEFAGRKFSRCCRVLYLALEESHNSVRKHLMDLGMTFEDAGLIRLISEDSKEYERLLKRSLDNRALAGEMILDWLKKEIEEFRPDIVIIDTLIDFIPLTDANAYAEMYVKALAPLRHIGRTTNAHIIVTHHENRSGEFMGSIAFKAAPDNMIRLEGKEKDFRTISAMRSNAGKVRYGRELTYTKLYQDGRAESATVEQVVVEDLASMARCVVRFVETHTPATQKDMVPSITKDAQLLSGILKHLVTDKQLKVEGRGVKGDPLRYYPPSYVTPLEELLSGAEK